MTPQVDLGGGDVSAGGGELGGGGAEISGQVGAGFRQSTPGPAGGAEPWETGQGTGLPLPRWLVLSRLREPSSWLPW